MLLRCHGPSHLSWRENTQFLTADCCSHSSGSVKPSKEEPLILSSPQRWLLRDSFFRLSIGWTAWLLPGVEGGVGGRCKASDSFRPPSRPPQLPRTALPPPLKLKVSLSCSGQGFLDTHTCTKKKKKKLAYERIHFLNMKRNKERSSQK